MPVRKGTARIVLGVVGPGHGASPEVISMAREVGGLIAREGWVTLTGGLDQGVMHAACGAHVAGGLTIGLLPGSGTDRASPALDIALSTALGEARNAVIASASDALVSCGMSSGTASEVALAIRAAKPVVLLGADASAIQFFSTLAVGNDQVLEARSPTQAIELPRKRLER